MKRKRWKTILPITASLIAVIVLINQLTVFHSYGRFAR